MNVTKENLKLNSRQRRINIRHEPRTYKTIRTTNASGIPFKLFSDHGSQNTDWSPEQESSNGAHTEWTTAQETILHTSRPETPTGLGVGQTRHLSSDVQTSQPDIHYDALGETQLTSIGHMQDQTVSTACFQKPSTSTNNSDSLTGNHLLGNRFLQLNRITAHKQNAIINNGQKNSSSTSTTIQINLTGYKLRDPRLLTAVSEFRSPCDRSLEAIFGSSGNSTGVNLSTPSHSLGLKGRVKLSTFGSAAQTKKNSSMPGSSLYPNETPSVTRTPRTPRTPKSCTSHESGNHTMIALTEGRGNARGHIGLAVIDIKRPSLVLCQISDMQTYTKTMAKINIINPVEVLIPNTFVEGLNPSRLYKNLMKRFPFLTITTALRRHFSDTHGLQRIQNICLPEYASVQIVLHQKFYALAAAAALIKYVEFEHNVFFAPKSIKIAYQEAEDTMSIDMETSSKLELAVSNVRLVGGEEYSLLGVLNHCKTVGGRRWLRANILQPPSVRSTIDSRLDTVTELVQNPYLLHDLQTAVKKLGDVELLLWLCLRVPQYNDANKASDVQSNYVLLLKTTIDNLPNLRNSLEMAQTEFLCVVRESLDDHRYKLILGLIKTLLHDDAKTSKNFSAMLQQRCFAIKSNVNGLLDVARLTYSELIKDLMDHVEQMAEEFQLPLTLAHNASKGYHIQFKLQYNTAFNVKDLPPIFIQVQSNKHSILCTTEEIVIFNQRINQAQKEVQLMSNAILFNLLQDLRRHIGCLYKLCENIAELDLRISCAVISLAPNFVRPIFGPEMKIKAARHPILDFIKPQKPVPNDVCASAEKNFHIITGPNMGGKSIYIRQVALLQVMAQIGCYVPAESAELRIADYIFARIGFDDSIECDVSTFVLEMREMQYIQHNLTQRSLVVIDELCRGTSNEEGTSAAWALCECLLDTKAFIFFSTHYINLSRLESIYSNVFNHHLEAIANDDGKLNYTYRLLPGITGITNYGLRLAQVTSLPQSIIASAREISKKIERDMAMGSKQNNFIASNVHRLEAEIISQMMNAEHLALEQVRQVQSLVTPEMKRIARECVLEEAVRSAHNAVTSCGEGMGEGHAHSRTNDTREMEKRILTADDYNLEMIRDQQEEEEASDGSEEPMGNITEPMDLSVVNNNNETTLHSERSLQTYLNSDTNIVEE